MRFIEYYDTLLGHFSAVREVTDPQDQSHQAAKRAPTQLGRRSFCNAHWAADEPGIHPAQPLESKTECR
jgi:hypothetical protein